MPYGLTGNNIEDKRRSKRVEATLEVQIEGKGSFNITNISKEGAFIAFTRMANYNIGPSASMSITIPELVKPVTAEADFVRYRFNEPSGFAVKFTNIAEEYMDYYESKID